MPVQEWLGPIGSDWSEARILYRTDTTFELFALYILKHFEHYIFIPIMDSWLHSYILTNRKEHQSVD